MQIKKALILDIDGTVRRSKSGNIFIKDKDDIELIPGIEDLLMKYRMNGYLVLGVSNQGGVAYGIKTLDYTEEELEATVALFKENPFHSIKACPHHEGGSREPYCHRSLLRKPDVGMLVSHEQEAWRHGYIIDWDHSLFIGDRQEDEECAKNARVPFKHIDLFLKEELNVAS